MRKLLMTAVVCLTLPGCATIAPNFSTESCLQKVAASEITLTAAYNGLYKAASLGTVGMDKTDDAEKILDSADAVLGSAKNMCRVETRNAFNLLSEAQSLVLRANEILGK